MKINKKYLYIVIALIVLVSIPVYCSTVNKKVVEKESAGYFKDSDDLTKITDAVNLIQNLFVGKSDPTKKELYQAAIAGMVNSLNDPYSEYFSKEDFESFPEDMDGNYVGVGMSIDKKKGEPLVVVSPFIGSPASKAGMKIGDKVIKVDNKDIIALTSTDAVKLLKGEKGTKVVLDVIREGTKGTFKVEIIRDEIKLEFVESKMLDNKVGYVSLLRFGNNTGQEIEAHIKKLQAQGMKSLIFDLRSNPGGSLGEAQDISSLFIKQKLVVLLKYKDGSKKEYNRTFQNLGDFPLVVLVNGGSASASEIVTGALKDYKRALIIGEKTFGKGIVQQIIPIGDGEAIKLTIAQYFTPKGNYIHEKGIEPDIKVEMNEILAIKGYANDSEEAKANRMKELEAVIVKEKGQEEATKIISAGDTQLKRAIEEITKMMK
jgi:carboxyl-terminal processing protease